MSRDENISAEMLGHRNRKRLAERLEHLKQLLRQRTVLEAKTAVVREQIAKLREI